MKISTSLIIAGFLTVVVSVRADNDTAALPRPLTLEAATAYALRHNPGLLRVQEQLREQEGVLVEVKGARLPNLGVAGSYSRHDKGMNESPFYEDDNWKVDVTVKQVLYAGGGVQAKVRGQREQFEAAKLTYTATVNDTLLAVKQQFYAVLLDRELIGVQEEALRVLETELVNARHRHEAGTGSSFDVLRADVAVANAKPALIRARNAYRVAQDKMSATLGAPPEAAGLQTELDVQGSLEVVRGEIALANALASAREHRPELLQQERLVKAAEQGIVGARSGYQPTVSAVAGYEWTKPSLITTPDSRLDGWIAGVQASWNIFDGKTTAGRVTQARSRANQARHAAKERALAVEVEVRQAHSALGEALELLASSEKVVEQARESLRLARARYEVGTATQLDILQAQAALTEARSNFAQAQHAHAVAQAALLRAMGSG